MQIAPPKPAELLIIVLPASVAPLWMRAMAPPLPPAVLLFINVLPLTMAPLLNNSRMPPPPLLPALLRLMVLALTCIALLSVPIPPPLTVAVFPLKSLVDHTTDGLSLM